MSNKTAEVLVALLVSTLTAACAFGRPSVIPVPPAPTDVAPPAAPPDPCLVVPHPESPRDSAIVVVEVRDRPWSGSPATTLAPGDGAQVTASSRASNFVIAQLYQPLVRVKCDGRMVPELAEELSADTARRSAHYVVRPGARFTDGASVTFDDVANSWSSRFRGEFQVVTFGPDPRTLEPVQAGSVSLPDSGPDALFGFAQLSRAISRRGTSSEWPTGSGPFLVDTVASKVNAGTTVLRPAGRAFGPIVIVREDSTRDQRDLLDRGVDILETRDPVVVDYARRGAFNVHPLPFDRTYVLAIPAYARVDTLNAAMRRVAETDATLFRSALARDAVRVEARPAETPPWWQGLSCGDATNAGAGRTGGAQAGAARIMYDAKDPVARSLAERLVAVARSTGANPSDRDARVIAQLLPELNVSEARSLAAVPVDDNSLRAGVALAFVIPTPTHVLARCASVYRLRQGAEWMSPSAMFPLIETRSFLVTRSGAPAVIVDWDGTLRIQPTLPVRR